MYELTRAARLGWTNHGCVLCDGTLEETFRRWPDEMNFISPSFKISRDGPIHSFDLNSIAKESSLAYSLHTTEHPSGNEYAAYLEASATDRS